MTGGDRDNKVEGTRNASKPTTKNSAPFPTVGEAHETLSSDRFET